MALLRKVDCMQLAVPDLAAGLDFYCNKLGHQLLWRTPVAAGLALPDSDAEIVLQTERQGLEVDFLVPSADEAAATFQAVGGTVVVPPFDIPVGRCVVVADPWQNQYVLLDTRNGSFVTAADKNVIGVEQRDNRA